MDIIDRIKEAARSKSKTVVLPEGFEERVRQAGEIIKEEGIARPILLDSLESSPDLEKYVELYVERRRHKGMTAQKAKKIILEDGVFFGALMVASGDADCLVAGASFTTRDVSRAVIHCIGCAENIKTISSAFLISLDDAKLGASGNFIFADCGIIPEPTPEQLVDITRSAADLARLVLNTEPKVALLSYSTRGSGGSGASIEKIKKALEELKRVNPEMIIDGELQLDAAVAPEVAWIKCPDSPVKGAANVLIFPNLDSGNIAYKLVNRLAKIRAIGPLFLGTARPASDLSRGCSVQDIVDAAAVTVMRS